MTDAILARYETGPLGTYGEFVVPGRFFSCAVVELPWKQNRVNESCIPCGTYTLQREFFDGFKTPHWGYRLLRVPGRTGILIHRGNHAGDVSLGHKSDVEGCLLPGTRACEVRATFKDGRPSVMQQGVVSSAVALERMMARLGARFSLAIESVCAETFVGLAEGT